MGHQDGQIGMLQNVQGRSTKDQLPKTTLRVGPFHQKIGPKLARLRQNRSAWRSQSVLNGASCGFAHHGAEASPQSAPHSGHQRRRL